MKNYSIVRVGNEYVVRAGEKSVLKTSSRRRAVKLITDAAELLQQQPLLPADEAPSISCDPDVTSCDPPVMPDPAEVP